jgi:hypothetical protein
MSEMKKQSRRRFLSDLACWGVASSAILGSHSSRAQSRPAAPTALRFPTKAVLGPGDFTYLGSFYAYNDGAQAIFQRGLTHRYVGGNLRLYTISSRNTGFHLYEIVVPAPNMSSYSNAMLANDFGNICSGKMVVDNPNPTIEIYGIYWDEIDGRMYWLFQDIYNIVCPESASIGYSTLDDSSHGGTGIKAVRMPASIGCKVTHGITPIPAAFALQYTKGWRLGLGYGGYESGVASGPASMGPALIAIDPAEITAAANQGYLKNAKVMVKHDYNGNDRTSPWRARRDTDYYNSFGDGWNPGSEPYGFWQWTDYIKQSAVWIDLPTKHGFLVMSLMSSRGNVTGAVSQTFATSPAPTTTSATLNGALPGLSAGDYVWFSMTGYSQGYRARIKSVNGLQITFDDTSGNPLPVAPNAPGKIFRGQFYSNGKPGSVHSKHSWFIYDPAELAKGAQGKTPVDRVQWTNSWDAQFPGFSYPLPSWGGSPPGMIVGTTFDPITNYLYVMIQRQPPLIAVYHVS